MRSLQPPHILWIYWRVYNSIVNTSKGVLFLPPSDAYVRSFLYLLYTLIKLYYTKALSDQASSLALDWIHLLWRPRIPMSFTVQQQSFTLKILFKLQWIGRNLSTSLTLSPSEREQKWRDLISLDTQRSTIPVKVWTRGRQSTEKLKQWKSQRISASLTRCCWGC